MHCPDCGFVNPDGANYCQKCGDYLVAEEKSSDQTTATYKIDEAGDIKPVDIDHEIDSKGAVVVVRAGGGRVGESFMLDGERSTIGRSPKANVFLDDVTVSRNHALIVRRRDGLYLDDLGSLNGTYVNRIRVESRKLCDGDELQIGKYKLAYLER